LTIKLILSLDLNDVSPRLAPYLKEKKKESRRISGGFQGVKFFEKYCNCSYRTKSSYMQMLMKCKGGDYFKTRSLNFTFPELTLLSFIYFFIVMFLV
jgi:hypothetical protein